MKVLITGSAGFIGSHLSEYLLSKGHSVTGLDNFDPFYNRSIKENNLSVPKQHKNFHFIEGDIRNAADLNKVGEVDAVIHIAAKAGVRPSIESPAEYVDVNINGTLSVLEWMRQKEIKKMVFASSSSVYGNNKKIPFSESDSVDNPISPYAFTKKGCELLNHTYHSLYNIDILNLRFFTVFGPRQRPDLAIRKFVDNILHDKPVHVFGDGSTARDYTFVADTCSGIYNALEYLSKHSNVFDTVNLGNHSPVKLIDMVNTIYKALGKAPNIVYEPMQPGDVDITYADITKAQKMLNYNPSTTFEEGINKFVAWYKASTV